VKPETAAYLANAEEALRDTKAILAIRIPWQAAAGGRAVFGAFP
jgi:hypothetical protein